MHRVEKNAAGEDVRVDTPDFGCIVIEAAAAPEPKSKAKAAKCEPCADAEGAE